MSLTQRNRFLSSYVLELAVVFANLLIRRIMQWAERDLGPSMLALVNSFRDFASSGRKLLDHPANHTVQPLASWRGTYGQIARTIATVTGIPVKHTI